MADRKLSVLTELATQPADNDEVYIRDVSEAASAESKRITIANLLASVMLNSVANANSMLYSVSDNTPAALAVAASRIVGRKSTGNIVALTAAELLTIINVAAGADVTGDNTPQAHTLDSHSASRIGKDRLEWTVNKLLLGAGVGSDPTEIDAPADPIVSPAEAGDIAQAAADTERNSNSTSYVKIKEIKLSRSGEYRVKFDLKYVTAATAYGRIYKNGTAVGTEQTDGAGVYATKSEDIAGWEAGDLLQLYVKHSLGGGFSTNVRNFRLFIDNDIRGGVVID